MNSSIPALFPTSQNYPCFMPCILYSFLVQSYYGNRRARNPRYFSCTYKKGICKRATLKNPNPTYSRY